MEMNQTQPLFLHRLFDRFDRVIPRTGVIVQGLVQVFSRFGCHAFGQVFVPSLQLGSDTLLVLRIHSHQMFVLRQRGSLFHVILRSRQGRIDLLLHSWIQRELSG